MITPQMCVFIHHIEFVELSKFDVEIVDCDWLSKDPISKLMIEYEMKMNDVTVGTYPIYYDHFDGSLHRDPYFFPK